MWKRMKDTEVKTKMNLDEMPLAALHKVSHAQTHIDTHSHIHTVPDIIKFLLQLNMVKKK